MRTLIMMLVLLATTAQAGTWTLAKDEPADAQPKAEVASPSNVAQPRELTPEELAFVEAEVARHNTELWGEDRIVNVTRALLRMQGIPDTEENRALFSEHLRQTALTRVTLPHELKEMGDLLTRKPAQEAFKPKAARSLTPLQRFPFEAGAGKASIRMPIGVSVPGFGRFPPDLNVILDPYDYAKIYTGNKGMHDDLFAKTVVIRHNGQLYGIMGVDAVAAADQLRFAVLSEIAARGVNIPRENFIFTATHNHSGPGNVSDTPMWQVTTADVFDQRVFDLMVARLVDSVIEAHANLEPATIAYGQQVDPQLPLQKNRREDPQKIDRELGVIRIDRASDGSALAVMFNIACHPSCLGTSNEYFTADFSGYAERKIEEDLGPNCVAIHINSALGDIDPTQRGFEGARVLGEDLANRVMALRATLTPEATLGLEVFTQEYRFPPPYVRPGHFDDTVPLWFTISLIGILEDRSDFTAMRLNDDAVITTIPGEAITDVGLAVKQGARNLGFTNCFVFGLAQHHLSYFTTEEEYWQGRYEAGASLFGPEGGDIVTSFALDVVDNVAQ